MRGSIFVRRRDEGVVYLFQELAEDIVDLRSETGALTFESDVGGHCGDDGGHGRGGSEIIEERLDRDESNRSIVLNSPAIRSIERREEEGNRGILGINIGEHAIEIGVGSSRWELDIVYPSIRRTDLCSKRETMPRQYGHRRRLNWRRKS